MGDAKTVGNILISFDSVLQSLDVNVDITDNQHYAFRS